MSSGSELRMMRRRNESFAGLVERPRKIGGNLGSPTILGLVVDKGHKPITVPGVFATQPSSLTFDRVEGAGWTLSPITTLTDYVYCLGPGVPVPGNVLIARQAPGGRWVAPWGSRGLCALVVVAYNCFNEVPPGAVATLISDESQAIEMSGGPPTGGTFVVIWNGVTSAPIPYNATAAEVRDALEAMSNIGAGNVQCTGGPLVGSGTVGAQPIVITFIGDLSKAPQPPITVDDSSLSGAYGAHVDVFDVLQGGITYTGEIPETTGSILFDTLDRFIIAWTKILDYYVFVQLQTGTWELRITAPGYNDLTQTITLACPANANAGGMMVPEDGKIITKGNPGPVDAPATASLAGDPFGCTSLSIVSCTGGIATYVGTGGAQTFTVGIHTFTKQSWFVATFGCSETLSIIWTFAEEGSTPLCNPHGTDYLSCLPGGEPGNGTCAFCSCIEIFWSMSGVGGQIPCGPCPNPDTPCAPAAPSISVIAGGGCFGATMVVPWSGDFTAPTVPGYAGVAVPLQVGTLWGDAFHGLSSIPCISASI